MSEPRNLNRTAAKLAGVVVIMGALAWASVPFYDWFCRVTGFGGATGVAEAGGEVLDQTIKVRFDASLERDMPWTFEPEVREIEVRIGEPVLVYYLASNPTDAPVAGQASYNVTPYEAGGFFDKIECFCFTEQVLAAGESVRMPVNFFVDPGIVDDREGKHVHTITLSYTFYQIDVPEDYEPPVTEAALQSPASDPLTSAAQDAIDLN